MTAALHDELLRQGPRDAGEPETADEISKRVVHDVSALPTWSRIAAGVAVLAEAGKLLSPTFAAIAWGLVAVVYVLEHFRSWIEKLEEQP